MTLAATDDTKTGRIAYLTGCYPAVSHTFILREVEALRRLGMEIETCSIRKPATNGLRGDAEQEALRTTFYVLPVGMKLMRLLKSNVSAMTSGPSRYLRGISLALRTRPPGLSALVYQLIYFAEAVVLSARLREGKVVHIHNHLGDSSGTVAMLTSQLLGISFSYTIHGPDLFFEPKKWRIDEKTARASFVACISHFCRSQAMLFSDAIHWPKLAIVHCGVLPEQYGHHERASFGKRVLFVGRLDVVKGVPFLLDAFERVRVRHPDARLTIVGDGPSRTVLEVRAKAPLLADAVTFTGHQTQSEISRLLEEVDMLVLPSLAEGVPVVLMEAMASRIPVIACRVGGVSELVDDGSTGFTVPPSDVETLTARLDTLLSDPDLCRRMGEAGRRVVEEQFSIEKEAIKLHDLFRRSAFARLPG